MTKFKVGDRVRLVNNGGYFLDDNQQSGTVVNVSGIGYHVSVDNYRRDLLFGEADLVPEKSGTAEILTRIAVIESELAALKALAQADEQPEPAPNAARKAVIEKARSFADEVEREWRGVLQRITFHVNANKGVVTALKHGALSGVLLDKAFARCAPGDVFNADIGKAIAVGRLYGVEVPAEFLDAPKPDKKAVGMRVKYEDMVARLVPSNEKLSLVDDRAHIGSVIGVDGVIIDDTEAQY